MSPPEHDRDVVSVDRLRKERRNILSRTSGDVSGLLLLMRERCVSPPEYMRNVADFRRREWVAGENQRDMCHLRGSRRLRGSIAKRKEEYPVADLPGDVSELPVRTGETCVTSGDRVVSADRLRKERRNILSRTSGDVSGLLLLMRERCVSPPGIASSPRIDCEKKGGISCRGPPET